MPIFYIHSRSLNGVAKDEEGEDFVDLKSARHSAREAGREIVTDDILSGADTVYLEFMIDNEAGEPQGSVAITANITCTDLDAATQRV